MANSIEVRVPDEIMDYKESIIAGLSIRQLVCGGVALLCGVPTFFLLKGISEDLAMYTTMAVVAPAFLIGFIKKDGYTFEKYAKIRIYNFLSKSKRGYETNPQDSLPIEHEEYRQIVMEQLREKEKIELEEQKEQAKGSEKSVSCKKRKKRNPKVRNEYEFIEVTEESIERKRKAAYKAITTARRKHKSKKQEKEKTA